MTSKNKQAKLQKNQEVEGEVIDITYEGLGVLKVDNFPIFVTDALPGELVKVGVTKVLNNYAFGRVIERIKTSPDRVENEHKEMISSGIAPLVNLKYDAQLAFKQNQIKELFHKVGIDDVEITETIGMDNPTQYRNKTVVPVKMQDGKLTTGFYRRGSHKLVPMGDYYLNDPKIDAAVGVVRDILDKYKVSAYDETTREGTVRYVMIRRGYYSHQMMLVIVATKIELPHEKEIIDEIHFALPELRSLILNYNPKQTNVQLGLDNRTLFGEDVIHDELLGLDFVISPNSFYQVNPQTTEILYKKAADMAELDKNDTVIDAYSGIGTIGLTVADRVKEVIGVEVVEPAVENAQINKAANNIQNAEFIANDAPTQFIEWAKKGIKPDVVFVDPPRKGLTSELIQSVGLMAPKKFVYVSCNPATLARDAVELIEQGYKITRPIVPIDQFPQTMHIESITIFEKNDEN
ncbi:MAG: 23S rRNA (uracil(1939)-C(5))-methyltransferase RlmD [Lactobacillaceae bacterium]|jgi:23S rRNA (uracil1939-C5)-methyltransferase|nr:23S rRNA (uracil(1939)-C(5))-methyltransferase RlmD [Lactobacillaceae bacterium]